MSSWHVERVMPRTTSGAWLHLVIVVECVAECIQFTQSRSLRTHAAATTPGPANAHHHAAPSFHHHLVLCPPHPCTDIRSDGSEALHRRYSTWHGKINMVRRRVFPFEGATTSLGTNIHLALPWRDVFVCTSYGGAIMSEDRKHNLNIDSP